MYDWEHPTTVDTPCEREGPRKAETADRGCELRGRFLALKHDAKHRLTRVVRKVDNTIHWINNYPVDSAVCFVNTYPLDNDLESGE